MRSSYAQSDISLTRIVRAADERAFQELDGAATDHLVSVFVDFEFERLDAPPEVAPYTKHPDLGRNDAGDELVTALLAMDA